MQPPAAFDWNDLRAVIAVLEHGSTKRAATAMKIDQTTCTRRIAAIEHALGLQLFDRSSGQYRPSEHALALACAARGAGAAVDAFAEQAAARARTLRGRLRVTVEEALAVEVVAPAVSRFAEFSPAIAVEIDITPEVRDLRAGEADLSLRAGLPREDSGVDWRKIADDPLGVYAAADYPNPPRSAAEVPGHPIAVIGFGVEHTMAAGLGDQIRHVANTWPALAVLISRGGVIGGLPRIIARRYPNLRCCYELDLPSAIWLGTARERQAAPGLRKLARLIEAEFAARIGD
jgi:DNA-binding transcriptional LysR family regulator